jgi:hypothetical protein
MTWEPKFEFSPTATGSRYNDPRKYDPAKGQEAGAAERAVVDEAEGTGVGGRTTSQSSSELSAEIRRWNEARGPGRWGLSVMKRR